MIEIKIHFCLIKSSDIQTVQLEPKDFFDPIDADETYENDGIQKFNDHFEYLEFPVERLKWTVLEVKGTNDDYLIRIQYMQKGLGWMSHRIDCDGSEEIMHVVIFPDNSQHVIKTTKPVGGDWMVVSNSICDAEENVTGFTEIEYYYENPDKLSPINTPGSFALATKEITKGFLSGMQKAAPAEKQR